MLHRALIFIGLFAIIAAAAQLAAMRVETHLFAPRMLPILLTVIAVPAYITWRIDRVIKKSKDAGPLSFGFSSPPKSASQKAREARIARRRSGPKPPNDPPSAP